MNGITIVTNALVVTCDAANRAGRLSLLIRDGSIIEVSEHAESLLSLHPNASVVDASDRLAIPGFVNAHHHLESFLLKERTRGKHLSLWKRDARLHEAAARLSAPGNDDDIRMLSLACYFSHLRSGTTTVGEYPPPLDDRGLVTFLQAVDRTNVRAVVCLQNWDQIRQAKDLGESRPPVTVNLGREDDFTVYSFEHLLRAAADLNAPPLAHVAEQRDDADPVRKNFQKELVPVLRDFGALRQRVCTVHMNHVPDEDIRLLEEAGVPAIVCPRSALWKQSGYPSLRTLLARNMRLALGTDWGEVDMLSELQFLHQLPLLVPGVPRLSPLELLRMGTINGAWALGVGDRTGSIEPGKSADLTFFSLASLGIPSPGERPTAQDLALLLLTSLSARCISDVMINGEFYLTKGEFMTMAEEDLAEGFRKLGEAYLPVQHLRMPREKAAARAKILPFLPDQERPDGTRQGFDQGFDAAEPDEAGTREDSVNLQSPPPSPPRTDQTQRSLPELSKDVRRVFGDDDV